MQGEGRAVNYLSIRDRGKGIPYGPGDRSDGTRNHGFRLLKGHPEASAEIPEILEDCHLRALLVAANDAQTGVFTVGCESAPVAEAAGFRRTGYVEFAVDDRTVIGSYETYFRLFFHFDRVWKREAKDLQAVLNWELQPAHFYETDVVGVTCAVVINMEFFPSQDEADRCWGQCLNLLAGFLDEIPAGTGERVTSGLSTQF